MKCFLTIIVLCIGVITSYAQNIDSIVTAEKNYRTEDTVKLNMQLYLSQSYASKKPDSGLIYAAKAISLATALNNMDKLGDAYRFRAYCYYDKTDFLAAVTNMQQTINCYKKGNIIWKVAYAHLSIADDYRKLSLFPQAIDNILQSIAYFEKIKFKYGTAFAVENLGLIYMSTGEYDKALVQFIRTKQIDESTDDKNNQARIPADYLNIGDAYMHLKQNDSAIYYNKKSFDLMVAAGQYEYITSPLFNLAFINQDEGKNLQALAYFEKAKDITRQKGDIRGVAISIANTANLYINFNDKDLKALKLSNLQQYSNAIDLYLKAINLYQESSSFYNQILDHYSLSDLYLKIPDSLLSPLHLTEDSRKKFVLDNIEAGLKKAKELNLLDLQQEGYQRLSYVHEQQKDYYNALQDYTKFIDVRDSISNAETRKKITQREMQYEFDKKESQYLFQQQLDSSKLQQQQLLNKQQQQELQLANQQKDLQKLDILKTQAELSNEQLRRRENEKQLTIANQNQQLQQSKLSLQQSEIKAGKVQRDIFIASCIALLAIAFFIFRNFYNQKKANRKLIVLNKQVSDEKQKSDELLLNILPEETAAELKQNGYSEARKFDKVTVLFTDIVNFTGISEHLSPQELVAELNYCFKAFDEISTKNNLEKIKTIGDAYLAVCGLPVADDEHALNTVRAAIGIRNFMQEYKAMRQKENKLFFELRLGINSGVVVAGIVGIKKYAYDIWGDTVNMAARMEEYSEPGKINISQKTYDLVKDHFRCTHRGKIEAKHKGEIDMYFVEE
ncbi:MAG: hypothetical protein JST21_14335 [Bacteroidetes bacterium]|nr:hypothetical protein [Bacteroidota bacterium]